MDFSSSYTALSKAFGCMFHRLHIYRTVWFSGNSSYDEVQLVGLNVKALCEEVLGSSNASA